MWQPKLWSSRAWGRHNSKIWFKNSYLFEKNSKHLNQQIAQIYLFPMRYDSLLNSKKWPSDIPKGSATPYFLPSLSVVLFCLLPNHPFSNLDFSGLGQPFFLNFDFAVSKWPKFNNWPTFSRNMNDLIHFAPHQTLCYFSGLLSVPASTRWPLHFGMVLSHFL